MRFKWLLFAVVALLSMTACRSGEQQRRTESVSVFASPGPVRTRTWSTSDLMELLENNKDVKRVWTEFEHSQKYRLAQPSDRILTPAAAARVNSNNENQILPYLMWWGVEGYEGRTDFLIAIVVDPSRSDPNRYGLIVIAAPKSEGSKYKAYWVAREEDMQNCLLSPASGSVGIECFRGDGTSEMKELGWYRSVRRFKWK